MLLLVKFVLVGLLASGINGDRDSIGISMAEESSDTFPIFLASHKPAETKRFDLRNFVPFQVSRRVSGLFGASSTNYPTSIQHKIPHLAKALGNTRYVTIAQDPTLVHPWKPSSDSWSSPEDNTIGHGAYDDPRPLTSPKFAPEHPNHHVSVPARGDDHHPHHNHHQSHHGNQHHQEKPPEHVRHRTYFPAQRPEVSDAPHDRPHDPGRNPDFVGQPHDYRSPRASREHPQDVEAPVGRHVHHLHYHSRHRHRESTRPPASSEEQPSDQPSSSRDPKDWSINLRYGHKSRNAGCNPAAREENVRRQGRQENSRSQSQQQRQPDSGRGNSSRSSQENQSRSSREDQRGSNREDQSGGSGGSGGSSGNGGSSGGQSRSRQGGQRRSTQEPQEPSRNGWRPNNLSWRNSPKLNEDQRPRYNDLPILRARWNNQPYRSQESRTVPDVQMIHDRPEWETIEQNFRDYQDPRGRKLVRNNRTTIIEEEFDKSPHEIGFPSPVGQSEYRYTGFPSYDHGDWFHQRQDPAPRKTNHFYPSYPSAPKSRAGDLDIEEILSEDEEADVGIVAIDNKAPNTTAPSRGNSSQDFLMNGELRFPDQNSAGLRELTELLKTVPEKQDNFSYNRNGTRGQVVRTTKNIAITRETFVDGRYDDRGQGPTKPVPQTVIGSPMTLRGTTVPPPSEPPQSGRVQRTAFASKMNGNFRKSDVKNIKIQPYVEQTRVLAGNERHTSRHTGSERENVVPHDPTSRNRVLPLVSGGGDDRGVVRKRVQRIQTHSTVEVLPLNTRNATGIPIYDPDDSSEEEEEDGDYPLSREHDTGYEPDYYQHDVPEPDKANTTSEMSITTTPGPIATTPPAPTRAVTIAPVQNSMPSPVSGRIRSQPKSWQGPQINKKLPTSKEWRGVISSSTSRPLENPRISSPQKTRKPAIPCDKKNCPPDAKPLVYQKPVGRKNSMPSAVKTATSTTTTPKPLQRDPVFTRRPTQTTEAPVKKRRVRRKRKKVTAAPSKETSPMVASGSQSLPLREGVRTPPRQFRKRKATEDEIQETPLAAATGDEGGEMRVQFHMQGFSGPESYRYGFHTADPYNPLERFEERDGEGRVRGHYSYIDPNGKRVVVNYTADQNGFQIVKGDGSSQGGSGGSGGGGQAAGNSGAGGDDGGNDNNNAADDNDDTDANADSELPAGGGGEPGPFGADYNENALDNTN